MYKIDIIMILIMLNNYQNKMNILKIKIMN